MGKYYHASRNPDLLALGLQVGVPTTCSRYPLSEDIYIGNMDYILNQYLLYCPKGLYYIYEIEIDPSILDEFPNNGQWRTKQSIQPTRILKKVEV